jgi:superfamily II DNA or RNA helicase
MNYVLRDYQARGKALCSDAFKRNLKSIILLIPTGGGKCLARGTKIMMHDGSNKNVEQINVGDLIMGPDSLHREVLSTTFGFETMYKIILKNGDTFTCNESHILSLVCSSSVTKKFIKGNIYDLSIKQYLSLPNHIKHCLKSYKVGIELPEKEIKIDPYFLGVWLGDGDSKGACITNMDIEIEDFLFQYSESINHKIRKMPNGKTKAFRYSITQRKAKWHSGLLQDLRNENLINNKHIPEKYLKNSRDIRLKLLAGLVDTDGYLHHNSYEIATCSKKLATDICWLSKSLGFNVSCNRNSENNAYRILISGHTQEIPVLIERKKASKRKQIKNVNHYSFTVEKLNIDEYFGFEITGDRRFVLGDFTVTHNTVVFADMVKEAIAKGTRVLILCNRKELIKQAKEKINASGLYPKLIIPGYKESYSNLYLASVDTLRNHKLPDVDLVIIDECHIRDFDEVAMEYLLRGIYVIGCTATAIRSGKRFLKEGTYLHTHFPKYSGQLGNIYQEIVEPTTISELLKNGYLVPAITYGAEVDTSDLKVTNTKNGFEFNEKQTFEKFNKPKMYGGVVDKYLQLTPNTKAMCFCVNVEHSIKQAEEFNLRGIPAIHVDGKSKDRERIFEDFKRGIYLILCNVGVATTGYDEPTVETIIVNKITMSLSLWLQMTGRGARLCEEINKNFFNIIDMGGNVYRHGFWEMDREYSLDLNYVSKTVGVAPIKECEKCQALIPASTMECKYCGMIQQKKNEEEKSFLDADFVVLNSDTIPKNLKKPLHQMDVMELEQFREIKQYSIGWVVRQLMARSINDLEAYARFKNYSKAWVSKQIELAENARNLAKQNIWEFMQNNPHITDDFLSDYAYKKLKATHTQKQIEILIPKILECKIKEVN